MPEPEAPAEPVAADPEAVEATEPTPESEASPEPQPEAEAAEPTDDAGNET